MKQTAVEWLVQEINKINVSTEARIFINKLEKQAKQMEKEQITAAYKVGKVETNLPPEKLTTGEQYYKEEYGKNINNNTDL